MHLAEVRIDLAAISHNLAWIKQRTRVPIMAMIKADAYGHGAVQVAQHLEKQGVQDFGVATLEEAKQLRAAGIQGQILVLQPFHRLNPQAFQSLKLQWLFQSPHDLQFVDQLLEPFHLMMDSGMGREGLQPKEFVSVWQQISSKKRKPKAICTHFYASDQEQVQSPAAQLKIFKATLTEAQVRDMPIHCANSGAIVNLPESYGDMVRPGILLYGQYHGRGEVDQKSAMSVWARVHSIKDLPAGHAVGYGPIYTTSETTKVGLLSLGYADGLIRKQARLRFVTWGEQKIRVLGQVSMDQIILDLNKVEIKEGDWVCIASGGEIIEEAQSLDTISYERCCQWGMRLPRSYGDQA